ncbi:MAG: kynureninase [Gammaproteobacteria bacterium]
MRQRLEYEELDRIDPLARFRREFILPDGLVYLDGNSLGAPPRGARERILKLLDEEWGRDLVQSWNRHDWIGLPQKVGAAIAPLIGAGRDEVIAADSTSVNLFKLLIAALRLRSSRRSIIALAGDFPTDLYIAQGVAESNSDLKLRIVEKEELETVVDAGTAVVMMNHVNFRTGAINDMAGVTALAHRHGALVIWDLCHSAGVMPVELNVCHVDFAVGCGYKYLNGGPGAPAFLFAARQHHDAIHPLISGWMGHAEPFEFDSRYRPAAGVRRNLSGTPPILSLAALDAALELFKHADMHLVREKSMRLGDAFIELTAPLRDEFGFGLISPADAHRRGSQVALTHPEGFAIMQALIARGVVGDFRAPDILRFGFSPLYNRYAEVWDAARRLEEIMRQREWARPEFNLQRAVT